MNEKLYVSGVSENMFNNQCKNDIYVIDKFNLRKSVIIPDEKI